MSQEKFSFENLDIWRRAVEFAKIIIDVGETVNTKSKHFRLIEQLESAAASVALNIAEGSGRYSRKSPTAITSMCDFLWLYTSLYHKKRIYPFSLCCPGLFIRNNYIINNI